MARNCVRRNPAVGDSVPAVSNLRVCLLRRRGAYNACRRDWQMIEDLIADLNEEGWALHSLSQFSTIFGYTMWECVVRKIGDGRQPVGRGTSEICAYTAITWAIARREAGEIEPSQTAIIEPKPSLSAILAGLGVERQSLRRR